MTKELGKSELEPVLDLAIQGEILPDELLWTVPDVARCLRASTSWVYKAAEQAKLPCIRIGTMLRFEPAVIRAWLAQRRNQNA